MKRFLLQNKQFIFLLGVLAVIYAVIVFLNAGAAFSLLASCFKYAGVAVCFLMALFACKFPFSREDARLLAFALLFTLIADALMLFASAPALGVLAFFIVHLLYIRRYKKSSLNRNLIIALIASLFSAVGTLAGLRFPYILLLGAVYSLLIFTAAGLAFRSNLPRINKRLAQTGMVLFILCDLNVAIGFFARSGGPLFTVANTLEWLFYIPSQALLALSSADYEKKPSSLRAE